MESPRDLIAHEFASLQQKRDELRVKLHLASEDAKVAWDELERKWLELEDNVKRLAGTSETTVRNVGEATRLLVDDIKAGYRRFVENAG